MHYTNEYLSPVGPISIVSNGTELTVFDTTRKWLDINFSGQNPISIIVPCHRVVGTNGSLAGYAGGIDKKIRLLELEKAYDTGGIQ